jgi:hypothetical protein
VQKRRCICLSACTRAWKSRPKNCISELASAGVELGFCVPPLAWTYWNMGPGIGPEYAAADHDKEWSKTTAATYAHNLFHVTRALKERSSRLSSAG